MLKCLNIVFTSMFSMECVLKIIAFGVLVGAFLILLHLFPLSTKCSRFVTRI